MIINEMNQQLARKRMNDVGGNWSIGPINDKSRSTYRKSNNSITGRTITHRDSLMSADNSYVHTHRPKY